MRAPTAAHVQLGRAMREVRIHLGVSQATLARRMDNTTSYVTRFENAYELPGGSDGGAWQRWLAAVEEIARSKPRDPAWHAQLHDQLTTTTTLYTRPRPPTPKSDSVKTPPTSNHADSSQHWPPRVSA